MYKQKNKGKYEDKRILNPKPVVFKKKFNLNFQLKSQYLHKIKKVNLFWFHNNPKEKSIKDYYTIDEKSEEVGLVPHGKRPNKVFQALKRKGIMDKI